MRIQVELRIVSDDSSVISEGEILHLNKGDDRLEVVGLAACRTEVFSQALRSAVAGLAEPADLAFSW